MDRIFILLNDGRRFLKYFHDKCGDSKKGIVLSGEPKAIGHGLVFFVYQATSTGISDSRSNILIRRWNEIWEHGFGKTASFSSLTFDVVFSLELNGQVIGVAGYNKYDGVIHMHSLALAREHLRKGYSLGFCREMIRFATSQGHTLLLIGVDVEPAAWLLAFYKQLGFRLVENSSSHDRLKFQKCIEYKYPWMFSTTCLKWMFLDATATGQEWSGTADSVR